MSDQYEDVKRYTITNGFRDVLVVDASAYDQLATQAETLGEENARLRVALTEIASTRFDTAARQIALTALTPAPATAEKESE